MDIRIKQISSLEKITKVDDLANTNSIKYQKVFANENFSYQVVVNSEERILSKVSIDSTIEDFVKVYCVKNILMDFPVNTEPADDDFITKEPGFMPDLLVPLSEQDNIIKLSGDYVNLWITVNLPENIENGIYDIKLNFKGHVVYKDDETFEQSVVMQVEKTIGCIPEQKIMYTQWFHSDCIASVHNVDIYSEEHWQLIDKYMELAADSGINMILTPVLSPAIDTAVGHKRPSTQLVKIYKNNGEYSFDFTLLKKWIELCKKNKMKYYEISHLFTQWGLHATPNIVVNEEGKDHYEFGWNVSSESIEYRTFLSVFLPKLVKFLKSENVFEYCYFHISDEPRIGDIGRYEYACNLVRTYIEDRPIIEALSNVDFYEKGFISVPATATDRIAPFLERKVENQWVYYCCVQDKGVSNRFMAMPSYRNRIIGIQLYKYNIKGFLQWGFNFYYSQYSLYPINPYVTTSADKAFPSGDAFSVYPGKNGPLPSLRGIVFKEALQDIQMLEMLEKIIGKEKTLTLIEECAGMDVTFDNYPRNADFIINLREKVREKILNS